MLGHRILDGSSSGALYSIPISGEDVALIGHMEIVRRGAGAERCEDVDGGGGPGVQSGGGGVPGEVQGATL